MRFAILLIGCGLAAQTFENLDAVLWVQSSAEYQAGARQTYASARLALDRALETPDWTAALEQSGDLKALPPAIILDLDETVLDNSVYMARLVKAGKKFEDESWNRWVAEIKSGLVPGAFDFLIYAKMRGVSVFFVTNRECKVEANDPTMLNLRNLGLGFGRLLCRTTTGDKAPRRMTVAATHRVLLLVGDDFNDFLSAAPTIEARQAQISAYGQFFGDRWFIVPNPMYGSWDRPFDSVEKKKSALRP